MGYGIFRVETATGRLNGCNFWCSGFGLQPSYTSTDQGVTPIFNLDKGFPPNPKNPPIFDPSLNNNGSVSLINWHANKMGTLQSWTFDIQRDLPLGIMLDAAYVGTKSNGTWTGAENPNQVDPKYLSSWPDAARRHQLSASSRGGDRQALSGLHRIGRASPASIPAVHQHRRHVSAHRVQFL